MSTQRRLYFPTTGNFAPARKLPRTNTRRTTNVSVGFNNGPQTPNRVNNRRAPNTPNGNRNIQRFKKLLKQRFELYLKFLNEYGIPKNMGASRNILAILENALVTVRPKVQPQGTRETNAKRRFNRNKQIKNFLNSIKLTRSEYSA